MHSQLSYASTSVWISGIEIFFSWKIFDVLGKLIPRFQPEVKNVTLNRFRVYSMYPQSGVWVSERSLSVTPKMKLVLFFDEQSYNYI